jgi:hypothetical protein
MFLEFVEEQVLLYCFVYLRPRLVLVLNNASIYKSAKLYCIYKERGVLLKFLLLYSLNFNLIENTFKNLKA